MKIGSSYTGPLEDHRFMESIARAERFDLQSAQLPAYAWEVPLKPLIVRIPFAVIDRLEGEAVDTFRSLDSRGSEMGGVLFGKATAGEPAIVSIEGYELIPCDYSRGPLFRLADADLARFDKVIAQHGAAGEVPVAGFFRSHTRKGLGLDAEDLALYESRFKDPRKIALLIRPYATKPATGGIFIWENGAVHSESSYLEFPFRSSLLTAARRVEPGDGGMAPNGLGGGPLPAPSVPKAGMRAQIVPIAPRREVAPSVPPLVVEPPATVAHEPEADAPASAPAAAAPEVAAPPPAPAVKVEKAAVPEPAPAEPKPAAPAPPAKSAAPANPPPVKIAEPSASAAPAPSAAPPGVEPDTKPEARPESEAPPRQSGKLIWIAIGAVVPIILMVVLFIYPALLHRTAPRSSSAGDTSALSLRVETLGGEMQLSWNRDSDPIRNATGGVLSISDGDQHQDVAMDLALLQKGSINYSPASSDVVFRLEVSGKGSKTASELVRALRTRPSPIPGVDPQAPAKTASPAAQTPAATPTGALPTPATEQPPPDEPATATLAKPVKPFRADTLSERLHPAPAASADLPDAPSVSQPNAPGVSASAFNMGAVAPPPPAPAPPAPAKTAPSTPAPAPQKAATGGQLQPAVLIHKTDPVYPRLARQTNASGVVELMATIGVDGKVKKVTVVKGHPMLVKAASEAVMEWLYRPTILNGVPVEGQTQVLINFTANPR